ncbi:MAG: endolytic transglycosylase MltG [Candidatus Cryptobacteroides sp.]
MKKKILVSLAIAGTLLLAAATTVATIYYIDNRRPGFETDFAVYVYPDTTPEEVMEELCAENRALSRRSLERCFRRTGTSQGIKPGYYPVKKDYPAVYVARMLAFGWQEPCRLTLSGTLRTKEKLAKVISSQMMVDSLTVASALNDAVFLSDYGFTPENVFALILPDTYQMYWTASIREIFDRFKKEYDRFWTDGRIRQAQAQGLTPMEVSVMASIVAGETLQADEFPIIAGVYLNRLHKGIKLQADPTVCFCFDYSLNRVLKKHLSVDSPYNTYKYAGLPPAPINIPSKACLEAVLSPASHDYIFFCASPEFNGRHLFAATYSEHLKNARAFQRALDRKMAEQNS